MHVNFYIDICNGIATCPDKSDEWNCNCSQDTGMNKCACKLRTDENVCVGELSCFKEEGIFFFCFF